MPETCSRIALPIYSGHAESGAYYACTDFARYKNVYVAAFLFVKVVSCMSRLSAAEMVDVPNSS